MTLMQVGDKVRRDQHSVIHEVKSVIRSTGSYRSIAETYCGKVEYASAFDLMSHDKNKVVETTCYRCKEEKKREEKRGEGGEENTNE
jgi:hypothetical protein